MSPPLPMPGPAPFPCPNSQPTPPPPTQESNVSQRAAVEKQGLLFLHPHGNKKNLFGQPIPELYLGLKCKDLESRSGSFCGMVVSLPHLHSAWLPMPPPPPNSLHSSLHPHAKGKSLRVRADDKWPGVGGGRGEEMEEEHLPPSRHPLPQPGVCTGQARNW